MGIGLWGLSPLCEIGISRRSVYQMTTSKEQARGQGNCGRATERGKEACECMGNPLMPGEPGLPDSVNMKTIGSPVRPDGAASASLEKPALSLFPMSLTEALPPPPSWLATRPSHAKTTVFRLLARLEKRLDFRCATRKTTPQAPCTELHGRYRTPKQLARNAKNPGKTKRVESRK